MSDLPDAQSNERRKANRWRFGALVFGLASVLGVIMTVLPLAVNDEQRTFLQQVDRAMLMDDFAGAQRQLEQRMAEGCGGTEYALRLGNCQSKQKDYDAARETFDRALADDPDEPRLLYNRALLDYRQRKYDQAMERLMGVVQIASYFPGVRYHIARIHEIQGRPEEALRYYVEELNVDPGSSSTWRRYLYLKRRLEAGELSRLPSEAPAARRG
ncbi:MAG TPA: tetratricopeptide repeat protein [Phycisphaerae bacterium]|nr:tetratricopeptide repeat protein [Phycisphaerae bacterium]